MKKTKVTLSALADQLGLSISTISKSLKNSQEISDETKELVVATAKKMGYKGTMEDPKAHKIIAVVIPDVINAFFAQVLTGIEQMATDSDYKIITCLTKETLSKETSYLEVLDSQYVDGIIIAVAEETQMKASYSHIQKVIDKGVPIVMFDRVVDQLECDKMVNDDVLSAARTVQFLVDKGDRTICVASTISNLSTGRLREEGIRNKIKEYDDVLLNLITTPDEKQFEQRIEDALKYDAIDAVIALDQMAGIMVLNKARELGISIPEKLQIICYSNGLLSEYSYPKMTVIDQHAAELGKKTFTRLKNLIGDEEEIKVTRIHTLKTSLIERGTTRK